jgi:hypothetical protein
MGADLKVIQENTMVSPRLGLTGAGNDFIFCILRSSPTTFRSFCLSDARLFMSDAVSARATALHPPQDGVVL